MSTRTFSISAFSPTIKYDPPQDLRNAVWKSDSGGLVNGNVNSGNPSRLLQGTGTVTINGFGSGLSFAGGLTGVYCSYTATLSPGEGNTRSASSLPSPQTASPTTGMLANFTGLAMDNWSLQLKGDCSSGSMIKIHEAIVEGWVGTEGSSVSNRTLDDTSSELGYSGVDWSTTTGLSAPFYDDSQHYTSVGGATMNITFSGSAIVVWSSVDNQHGPYAASLYYASTLVFSSDSTLSTTSYNPFLAVPVPFYFASGLDPTQTYTLCLQTKATNGTYLDVDYVEVYTSTGGGPPNGGTAALPSSGNGSTNMAAIIGGAVGGGVGLLLLLLIAWWLWRRRKTQIDRRNGGTQPLSMKNAASPIRHDVPVQLNRAVVPIPYGAHTPPQHDPYSAERQGLLYAPHAPGSPQVTANSYTTSSGYDPYASFGGNYPSPHSSSYTGLPAGAAAALDPVHARRQGKAAEIDAARERMRLANAGSTGALMSPSTTMSPNTSYTHHPPHPPASSLTQTMTGSQVPSWDAGSQAGQSTTAQTSTSANNNGMNVPLGDVKTPEDPPPSYEHP